MKSLLWIAIALLIIWVLARFALAVTGFLLHLVGIAALVLFAVWIFRNVVKWLSKGILFPVAQKG